MKILRLLIIFIGLAQICHAQAPQTNQGKIDFYPSFKSFLLTSLIFNPPTPPLNHYGTPSILHPKIYQSSFGWFLNWSGLMLPKYTPNGHCCSSR